MIKRIVFLSLKNNSSVSQLSVMNAASKVIQFGFCLSVWAYSELDTYFEKGSFVCIIGYSLSYDFKVE